MANARKTRARKARRRDVNRGDRVKATPETLAKLKPHPLELLLARGREGGGIDADQLQCAEEIADAAQGITRGLGWASSDPGSVNHGRAAAAVMSAHEERLAVIWFAWANELARRHGLRPFAIVEQIGRTEPHHESTARLLCRGLDLWAKVRREVDKQGRDER